MAPPGPLIFNGQYSDPHSAVKVKPDGLSPFRSAIERIVAHRANSPSVPTGVAAKGECDLYRSLDQGKPQARRWDRLLNAESSARQPCSLKAAAKYLKNPGMISLGGGLPSSDYFPIQEMNLNVSRPVGGLEESCNESPLLINTTKDDIALGRSLFGTVLTDPLSSGPSF